MRARHGGCSEKNGGEVTPLGGAYKRGGAVGGSTSAAADSSIEGKAARRRLDRCARGGWIKDAIKRPGALHRALNVPEGEKIPAKKLAKASHSDNPRIRKEAALAKTLSGFHH